MGKGSFNWDKFVRIPGKTFKGTTGDKAVDHYNRYKEDVALAVPFLPVVFIS